MARRPESDAIMVMPPYSPDEALFRKLSKKPWNTLKCALCALMPMPKLTAK